MTRSQIKLIKPKTTPCAKREITPYTRRRKRKKGQTLLDAADDLLGTAVSKVRQPIESFFNWINQKTGSQTAGKVRSYNGLIVHVFGRLAAAYFLLFKPC